MARAHRRRSKATLLMLYLSSATTNLLHWRRNRRGVLHLERLIGPTANSTPWLERHEPDRCRVAMGEEDPARIAVLLSPVAGHPIHGASRFLHPMVEARPLRAQAVELLLAIYPARLIPPVFSSLLLTSTAWLDLLEVAHVVSKHLLSLVLFDST
jgi:hypothetical protein